MKMKMLTLLVTLMAPQFTLSADKGFISLEEYKRQISSLDKNQARTLIDQVSDVDRLKAFLVFMETFPSKVIVRPPAPPVHENPENERKLERKTPSPYWSETQAAAVALIAMGVEMALRLMV